MGKMKRPDWMYELTCEVMSRNPEIACHTFPPEVRHQRYPKGQAQQAVNDARAFVRDFSDADIPERHRRHYSGADLPRAMVRKWAKESRPLLFACRRGLDGEYVEDRFDGKETVREPDRDAAQKNEQVFQRWDGVFRRLADS